MRRALRVALLAAALVFVSAPRAWIWQLDLSARAGGGEEFPAQQRVRVSPQWEGPPANPAAAKRKVVVVKDRHPLLVGADWVWENFKGPIVGFGVLCFAVGFVVVVGAALKRYNIGFHIERKPKP